SVTVRQALEQSLNVPAVRVAMDVGTSHVADVAHAVGIDHPLAPVPSLALGTSEVTLLEMTSAYATLSNAGVRVVPTTLVGNLSASGPALAPLPASYRAVSAESAFLITHLLRGVMRRGTGAGSAAWGLQETTAGKTGTTDGLRDAWFVGYTPSLVIGVGVGVDDGTPLGLTRPPPPPPPLRPPPPPPVPPPPRPWGGHRPGRSCDRTSSVVLVRQRRRGAGGVQAGNRADRPLRLSHASGLAERARMVWQVLPQLITVVESDLPSPSGWTSARP